MNGREYFHESVVRDVVDILTTTTLSFGRVQKLSPLEYRLFLPTTTLSFGRVQKHTWPPFITLIYSTTTLSFGRVQKRKACAIRHIQLNYYPVIWQGSETHFLLHTLIFSSTTPLSFGRGVVALLLTAWRNFQSYKNKKTFRICYLKVFII